MKPDNPPAFPFTAPIGNDGASITCHGMTLRDWFAGQALAGLLHTQSKEHPLDVAKWAYLRADALLAEREKRND
jgi:hypothetical protein